MYCRNCGSALPDGSQFCSRCGQRQDAVATPTPAPAAPSVSVPVVKLDLDDNVRALVAIAMSVATCLISFMPWLSVEESWYTDSWSANIFQFISEMISGGESLSVFGFITAIFGIACLILHICNIYGVVTKNRQRYSYTGAAGLITGIFSIVYLIVVALMKSTLKSEYGYAAEVVNRVYQCGAGAYVCLVLSILQYFIGSKLMSTSVVKEEPKNWVTCPGCNTSYVRMTSATRCPACGKLPGEAAMVQPAPKPVPKTTVTCPFCKRVYPSGTKYCQDCNAQIGA